MVLDLKWLKKQSIWSTKFNDYRFEMVKKTKHLVDIVQWL